MPASSRQTCWNHATCSADADANANANANAKYKATSVADVSAATKRGEVCVKNKGCRFLCI